MNFIELLLQNLMFQRLLSRPIYLAAFVALAALVVYLQTLAPSADFIDAGELATVCTTLGIAHPTGYPLFTLVGWVFAHLPIGGTAIYRLNIMAAFFTAMGAGGVVLLANELFSYWMPERIARVNGKGQRVKGKDQKAKGKGKNASAKDLQRTNVAKAATPNPSPAFTPYPLPSTLPAIAGFATGIITAFSATWWAQSCSIEVYPLHLFMLPLVLVFFLRMLRNDETEKVGRDGKIFAVLLGLSFANHMTTVLLAPACLYMFFARYKFSPIAWKRILRLAPFFIAGLLVYIYMPIRSAQFPPMDWGHTATWTNFLHHVTAKQFQIWMYTGSGAATKQWSYFWSRVPKEFTIVGALLALAGLWKMFNAASIRRTHILAFTLLLFFGCLFYSINYDIHDIDSYFLLAFLAVALWIGAGMQIVSSWLDTSFFKQMKKEYVLVGVAVILGMIEIGANFSDNNESGNCMVEDYTMNMLHNLPPNAIIFSTQWDFWVSGAFYYQLVEHVRPDVLVIDKAMLRDRPWYYAELEKRAPEVFAKVKPEEEAFLKLLRAFDAGEPFDQNAIAPAYESFTSALVERNLDRPIFATQEMVDQRDDLFAPKMKIIPAGIAYRMFPHDTTFDAAQPKLEWRDKGYRLRDYYTDDSRLLQAMPIATYAAQRLRLGDTTGAKHFLDAALLFTPDLAAKLDGLSDRDREIADAANEKFTQIQALRNQLH
jgi:hypothetical protein